MPLYTYIDKTTGYQIDILRNFAQYQDLPNDTDLPEEEQGKERDWEKQLGTNVKVIRGENWGPGKGNWGR